MAVWHRRNQSFRERDRGKEMYLMSLTDDWGQSRWERIRTGFCAEN